MKILALFDSFVSNEVVLFVLNTCVRRKMHVLVLACCCIIKYHTAFEAKLACTDTRNCAIQNIKGKALAKHRPYKNIH